MSKLRRRVRRPLCYALDIILRRKDNRYLERTDPPSRELERLRDVVLTGEHHQGFGSLLLHQRCCRPAAGDQYVEPVPGRYFNLWRSGVLSSGDRYAEPGCTWVAVGQVWISQAIGGVRGGMLAPFYPVAGRHPFLAPLARKEPRTGVSYTIKARRSQIVS